MQTGRKDAQLQPWTMPLRWDTLSLLSDYMKTERKVALLLRWIMLQEVDTLILSNGCM
jgi:hypothetical protein